MAAKATPIPKGLTVLGTTSDGIQHLSDGSYRNSSTGAISTAANLADARKAFGGSGTDVNATPTPQKPATTPPPAAPAPTPSGPGPTISPTPPPTPTPGETSGPVGAPGPSPGLSPDPSLGSGIVGPTQTGVTDFLPPSNDPGQTPIVNPTTSINTATGLAANDTARNDQLNNPSLQKDALGNSQDITVDPVTGATTITKNAGAGLTAANNAFTSAATGLGAAGSDPYSQAAAGMVNNGAADRTSAQNATYNYITQNYGTQKTQEVNAAQQSMQNQGIPYSSDPNSRYQQTLTQIDQKYQSLDDQAKNQAITAGNSAYSTDVSAVGTLGGLGNSTYSTDVGAVNTLGTATANQNPTFTAFQGANSNQAGAYQTMFNNVSSDQLQQLGISASQYQALQSLITSTNNAKIAANASMSNAKTAANASTSNTQAAINANNSGANINGVAP